MDTTTILIILAVLAVIAIVVAAVAASRARARRREALQERFGPEYERAVEEQGSRRRAEAELDDRSEHRRQLDIRPLSEDRRAAYASDWQDVQAQFVDEPALAVKRAHVLITEVMRERGYPVDDFDTRARDLSVDHPDVVDHYREANRLTGDSAQGRAGTEDLRQAMVHFRALFDRLLQA